MLLFVFIFIRRPHWGQQAVRLPLAVPPLSRRPGIQVVLAVSPRGVPPPGPRGGPPPGPQGGPPGGSPAPPLLNPGGQKAPAGRPSVIPKAKYMTLGSKFFFCSKMTVTRRRKHLFQ